MSNEIEIEIDGKNLKANKGQMLIEVADQNDIYIPRFCYHRKLSVAANCRMCLVDVEKAPKPLPACATPVMDGMKVQTQSQRAIDAQKSVMEFLLINHPLDCPICDQGGECELQDLAMGYGEDVSRYQESKRVVKDKNIGSLVQTDMTRCIHCTRCVRFGEEVAGIRELGATGRGEHMEIGTYIEKAMVSEMSGNVIDLCPVGALTSKPYRFSARAWELVQRPTIAPHDCVGSNINLHIKSNIVKRVVPNDNEAINETWISDRDRFSYQGLYHEKRLHSPMIKQDGEWKEVDWQTAITFACNRFNQNLQQYGKDKTAVLASPNSSIEELHLLQKMMRAMDVANIDHRVQQTDFANENVFEPYPSLLFGLDELENQDVFFLIGSDIRKDQPIINHRIRKAVTKGAKVSLAHVLDVDANYNINNKCINTPLGLVKDLVAVLKALFDSSEKSKPKHLEKEFKNVEVTSTHQAIAEQLSNANKAAILIGNYAQSCLEYSAISYLAENIARLSGATLHTIPYASNIAGACLTGLLPHRQAMAQAVTKPGMNIKEMFATEIKTFFLLSLEPELDCVQAYQALNAMQAADCVISLTAYKSDTMLDYADVLLPIAGFAETSGHKMNITGETQAYNGAVMPQGEARPAWKILRVMANEFGLDGFEYSSSEEVFSEFESALETFLHEQATIIQTNSEIEIDIFKQEPDITILVTTPTNSVDSLVRHAEALQATNLIADGSLHISADIAEKFSLEDDDKVTISVDDKSLNLPIVVDTRLAKNCVLLHGGQRIAANVNVHSNKISLRKGS